MSSRPTSRPVFHTWMRRKSVRALRRSHAEHSKQHGGLKRVLGLWSLVAIGIGCTIGAGIFVMPGIVAATHAGPGILLSFMLAGVACALEVAEDLPELVVVDLADVGGAAAEAGHPAHRVGGRPTAHLHR